MRLKFIITFTLIRSQFKTKSRVKTVIHATVTRVIRWLYNVDSGGLKLFKMRKVSSSKRPDFPEITEDIIMFI